MPVITQAGVSLGDKGAGRYQLDYLLSHSFGIKDAKGQSLVFSWLAPDSVRRQNGTVNGTVFWDGKRKGRSWAQVNTGAVPTIENINNRPAFRVVSPWQNAAVENELPDRASWGLTGVVAFDTSLAGAGSNYYVFGLGRGPSVGSGGRYPSLVFNTGANGSEIRLSSTVGSTTAARARTAYLPSLTSLAVVTVGFDTTSGFRFMVNGISRPNVLAADLNPLDYPTVNLGGNRGSSSIATGLFPGRIGLGVVHAVNPLANAAGSGCAAFHQSLMKLFGA